LTEGRDEASWRTLSASDSTDCFETAEAKAAFRGVLDWLFVVSLGGPDGRGAASALRRLPARRVASSLQLWRLRCSH